MTGRVMRDEGDVGAVKPKRDPKLGLRPHALPWKLMTFFEENPGEELTIVDAMAKFGVGKMAVYDAIRQLDRYLERVNVVRKKAGT